MNITYSAWDSNQKSGEIGRIEKDGENKTWRAFEKGTAASLWCCRKLAGLLPCLGCGNGDVDALSQWQEKDQKPNLCSQCPIPCCHTLKITVDRWIPAGRASLQSTLTNNGFDQSRGPGMKHNPRALSPVVFLCSSEKEATSCIGKLAMTAIRSSGILPLFVPQWIIAMKLFWVVSNSRPHPHGNFGLFFPKL